MRVSTLTTTVLATGAAIHSSTNEPSTLPAPAPALDLNDPLVSVYTVLEITPSKIVTETVEVTPSVDPAAPLSSLPIYREDLGVLQTTGAFKDHYMKGKPLPDLTPPPGYQERRKEWEHRLYNPGARPATDNTLTCMYYADFIYRRYVIMLPTDDVKAGKGSGTLYNAIHGLHCDTDNWRVVKYPYPKLEGGIVMATIFESLDGFPLLAPCKAGKVERGIREATKGRYDIKCVRVSQEKLNRFYEERMSEAEEMLAADKERGT